MGIWFLYNRTRPSSDLDERSEPVTRRIMDEDRKTQKNSAWIIHHEITAVQGSPAWLINHKAWKSYEWIALAAKSEKKTEIFFCKFECVASWIAFNIPATLS